MSSELTLSKQIVFWLRYGLIMSKSIVLWMSYMRYEMILST